MLKGFLGIIAGLVVAFLLIFAIQELGRLVFPPQQILEQAGVEVPEGGINYADPDQLRLIVENAPWYVLALVPLSWFIGTLIGALLTAHIAPGGLRASVGFGFIMLALGLTQLFTIPHPLWMWIAGCAVFLPAAIIGGAMAGPKPKPWEVEAKKSES